MVPDYQTLMLPVLHAAKDGQEHHIRDVIQSSARELNLSDNDIGQMLPSGKQTVLSNRVHWATTYLAQARCLERPRRAHYRITDRGRELLAQNPTKITSRSLEQFPEFVEFRGRISEPRSPVNNESPGDNLPDVGVLSERTPDEVLRATVKAIDAALSGELLDRILSEPPSFFEELIVTLLLRMGYGGSREDAGRAVGKTGDGGIDGVIDQDPLGLERIYLQAKRYKADLPVSESEVRSFSGSLGAAKANKGVFVTTSYFTRSAQQFAEKHPFKLVLIDGDQLATLMIRHDVGVRTVEILNVKKIDEDFFGEE